MKKKNRGKKPPKPFRSWLEWECNELLKASKLIYQYEPKQLILIPENTYSPGEEWRKRGKKKINTFKPQSTKINDIKYTPDFVGPGWVIETKGYFNPRARLQWTLFKHWMVKQNLSDWDLYMPTTIKQVKETIKDILNKKNYVDKNKLLSFTNFFSADSSFANRNVME